MSMMGYRSRLSGSVAVLTGFYSAVGIAAFYAMGPMTLENWLTQRGLWDRAEDGPVTALNAASIATRIVIERAVEAGAWALAGIGAAIIASLLTVMALLVTRNRRKISRGDFRGLSASISRMPTPAQTPRTEGLVIRGVKFANKRHKALFQAIMGYLKTHEHDYCGEGHEKGLFAHTMGVLEAVLEIDRAERDPLLLLAAAAHDIGKASSYVQRDGKWVRVRYHDKESARIMASFPEWWALPDPERSILLYAVKHEHSPNLLPIAIPGLSQADIQRLGRLVEQLREVDGNATRQEKEDVRENLSVEDVVIEAFLDSVANAPFQKRGLAKGIQAVGWRDGDRLYILERAMREFAMARLSALHAAVLGGSYRDKGEVADFTKELLAALEARGWLITEHEIRPSEGAATESCTLPTRDMLWRVQSGTHTFNGVYIVELPKEHRHIYPKQTLYELTVLGTLDQRKPAPAAPRKPQAPATPKEKALKIRRSGTKAPNGRALPPGATQDEPIAVDELPSEELPTADEADDIQIFSR